MKKVQLNKFWTFFDLSIFDENFSENNLENLKKEILNKFENYENIFSRFRKNSELSKINQNKEWKMSLVFFELFEKIMEINTLTNWFFNPFVEIDNLENNNLNKNKFLNLFFSEWEKKFQINKNFFIKNWKIVLEKNINLDFWWIWKWYFVDLIWKKLKEKKIDNFIINFWWDIYTNWEKINKQNTDNKENNTEKIFENKLLNKNNLFRIWIQNPFLNEKNIWYIDLKNKSISSSWRYFKNWEIKWKKYHHIVNPFTNSNELEIQMVTIISEKTYFTDSIATAVFNMWIVKWMDFLKKNKIDWIIIWENKKAFFTEWFRKKFNFNEKN